ncbi:hypothetical protein [Sorangium sp. So ce854]|uniref:hypothetical protein n=1 Tax=Sorangium sp. So ce854 TaxID=3133322 RepID=UPI003F5E87A8
MRALDATFTPPRLLFLSLAVRVNVDAGRMPPPRENGRRYLVTPLNDFRAADEVGIPRKRLTVSAPSFRRRRGSSRRSATSHPTSGDEVVWAAEGVRAGRRTRKAADRGCGQGAPPAALDRQGTRRRCSNGSVEAGLDLKEGDDALTFPPTGLT